MGRYNHADHLINKYYRVLDKGFVGLYDYSGSDTAIEDAARASYQRGTRKTSDQRALLRYLSRHRHDSPIEQANITVHFRLPLYVIQQILRHRTAKLNQESFRYSEVPDIEQSTLPDQWRIQSTSNKQGSDGYVEHEIGKYLSERERELIKLSREVYKERLKYGVAKEQARKDIPVSTYSSIFWTMDVRNLCHFIGLRSEKHAQLEVRAFSDIIGGFVKEIFPQTFEAWYDYKFQAATFTRLERKYLAVLNDRSITEEDAWKRIEQIAQENGINTTPGKGREFQEFKEKLIIPTEKDFSLSQFEEINIELEP